MAPRGENFKSTCIFIFLRQKQNIKPLVGGYILLNFIKLFSGYFKLFLSVFSNASIMHLPSCDKAMRHVAGEKHFNDVGRHLVGSPVAEAVAAALNWFLAGQRRSTILGLHYDIKWWDMEWKRKWKWKWTWGSQRRNFQRFAYLLDFVAGTADIGVELLLLPLWSVLIKRN